MDDLALVRAELDRALQRLNHHRLRASRGFRTAAQDDALRPHWSDLVSREAVVADATCGIQQAMLNSVPGRARRRAIRQAILGALESHSVLHEPETVGP